MTDDKLQSWNETPVKKKIVEFVESSVNKNSPGFIPPAERIAAFDNDGTLWTEQPLQIQFLFAMDRLKELSIESPELKDKQPFKAFLEKDIETLKTFTKKELMEFAIKTHAGKTAEIFSDIVMQWFENSVHPKFGISYYNCAYKPQLELLAYLQANGFKTFIVSGGGLIFMRAVAEKIYGIPPEQIIGTSGKTKVVYEGTNPVVTRLSELQSFDDKDEKVNNIALHIGRIPVFVFGNSDGDLPMMRYAIGKRGIAFLLHHDDDTREAAYDRNFKLSPLNEALDAADKEGINIVSMKNDWKEVFA